mgnify:CR=1 FL=1
MENLFEFYIQQACRLVLDCHYIIGTSKNIETMKGRYILLLEHFETLKQGQDNSDYFTTIVNVIELHNRTFPNAPLQKYQLEAISDPNAFNLIEFYCNSLYRATITFYYDEAVKINTLKSKETQIPRVKKLLNTINMFKNELLDKRPTENSNNIALEQIEKVEQELRKLFLTD